MKKSFSYFLHTYIYNTRIKQLYFNSSGLTLIELIVAIGIISILAMAILSVVDPGEQFKKANDSKRKSDLAQIQRVLEAYYQDHGRYPGYNTLTYQIKDEDGNDLVWGTSAWPPYIDVLPKDPIQNNHDYVYIVDTSNSNQTYWLYAGLERGSQDAQACSGGSTCPNAPIGACGGTCNYGVTSPNTSP